MRGAHLARHDRGVVITSPSLQHAIAAVAFLAATAAAHARSPCRVDPFGAESAAERAALLARGCGGERVDYRLESLRDQPTDPGPSMLAARIDAATTKPLADRLLGTLRLNWSAAGSERGEGLLRTERTAWAAGTWWQPQRSFGLQVNVGREYTAEPRTRATFAGIWRPLRGAVLFAEWAGDAERTEGHRVGLRWWLVRHRLALEAGASRLADTGWVDKQVRLSYGLLN